MQFNTFTTRVWQKCQYCPSALIIPSDLAHRKIGDFRFVRPNAGKVFTLSTHHSNPPSLLRATHLPSPCPRSPIRLNSTTTISPPLRDRRQEQTGTDTISGCSRSWTPARSISIAIRPSHCTSRATTNGIRQISSSASSYWLWHRFHVRQVDLERLSDPWQVLAVVSRYWHRTCFSAVLSRSATRHVRDSM